MFKNWFNLFNLAILSLFATSSFAGEEDLYDFLWLDPDKSVYVLQNKIYPKDKSFYVDLGLLMNQTNKFQDTSGAQFKAGYYFSEEWALEFDYVKYSNLNNSALDSLIAVNGVVPFIQKPLSSSSLFAIWSPFYGKINTFNQIYYFDWSFGLGAGSYTLESNLDTVQDNTQDIYKEENVGAVLLKTNFKFHINRNLHLGVELLNTNYQFGTPKNPNSKGWDQNNDIIFSIGASF